MRSLDFRDYVLSACAAAAMLAGCGGSQPPIGAPAAMPQVSAIATHAERGKSWMKPEASGDDLVYATGACNGTCVLSYPENQLVGTLPVGNGLNSGACADPASDVFITDTSSVYEYAHGASSPVATLSLPGSQAAGCSIDPSTGNLAVDFAGTGGDIAVFE
jgi:hypothetical protein